MRQGIEQGNRVFLLRSVLTEETFNAGAILFMPGPGIDRLAQGRPYICTSRTAGRKKPVCYIKV
jgi:hypothetical protein